MFIVMSVFALAIMSCNNNASTPSTTTDNADTITVIADTIVSNNDSIVNVENDTINKD